MEQAVPFSMEGDNRMHAYKPAWTAGIRLQKFIVIRQERYGEERK